MQFIESKQWINSFKKSMFTFSLVKISLLSLGISILLSAIWVKFNPSSFILVCLILTCIIFLLLFLTDSTRKISFEKISSYLNLHFPEVQESCHLIIKPTDELSLLQKFQAEKVNRIIPTIPIPQISIKRLKLAIVVFMSGILLSAIILNMSFNKKNNQNTSLTIVNKPFKKDKLLPVLKNLDLIINSPLYTGLKSVKQHQFSFKAIKSAKVKWIVTTNATAKKLAIVFNDKDFLSFKPQNKDSTIWSAEKTLNKPGFYQVKIDDKFSDFYQIEIIEDQPVNIKIISPKQQNTIIDFGEPQKLNIKVTLFDDFAIKEAFINATIASGKGEGVSFKERNIAFNENIFGKQLTLNKLIDLSFLGLKPGDELYFFISAKDNYGQQSRSDAYSVAIQDTSELMSMAGLVGGVNLVPEYFRSQRQIIIDTEKLLRERESITNEDFKNRSNNLGIDQKLLRLRYGKFLGEESETNIGEIAGAEEHHDGDGHNHSKNNDEEKFGDVKAIMDQYAHKHDNSEDATFFEPTQKAKLKATLTEMWNAELRLRTFKTTNALPFEYKALRLLKDLQQSSRAYVGKTVVKTTLLKEEKRLTGELNKITEPLRKANYKKSEDKINQIKNAIGLLENSKQKKLITANDRKGLINIQPYLIFAATNSPNIYLGSLKAIKKVISDTSMSYNLKDIDLIESALYKILKTEMPLLLPVIESGTANSSLGQTYLDNLKKTGM